MSATESPIHVRARITVDEWRAIQVAALHRNTAPADLIALALRTPYAPLNPKGTDTDGTDHA